MTVAECGGGGEEEVALGSSLFAKGPLQGPSRSAEAGLRSGRAGLDPCGGEGLSLMMEVGWEGWGVDWDGRVDVAPPRCQASCRRAESSLRTPGARRRGMARPAIEGIADKVALQELLPDTVLAEEFAEREPLWNEWVAKNQGR